MNVRHKFVLSVLAFTVLTLFVTLGLSSWLHFQYLNFLNLLPKSEHQKELYFVYYVNRNEQKYKSNRYKLVIPQNQIYLGIDTKIQNHGVSYIEQLVSKNFAVVNNYAYWGEDPSFKVELAGHLWLENKILMVTWNPSKSMISNPADQPEYRLSKILDGKFDTYIKRWAFQINKWNRPVIIRFAPEMNGDWLPWGTKYTTSDEYIETYRYVVDKFRKYGADNVSWMWSPNEVGNENVLDFYPGDRYVDWIGLSGFNWGDRGYTTHWRSLEDIYQESLTQLDSIEKPIALVELGSVESASDPEAKANWITETFESLRYNYPDIKMIVWVNEVSFGKYDWRVDTSGYSLNAFKESISHQYFLDKARYSK